MQWKQHTESEKVDKVFSSLPASLSYSEDGEQENLEFNLKPST